MGFLEFMLGKRLFDDDVARGLNALASSPKLVARRIEGLTDSVLKAALAELDLPGARWKSAGEVTLLPSGEIKLPDLPDRAGILRLELRGPAPSDVVVMLFEHASLRAQEPGEADEEIASELLAGVRFVYSFIDSVATGTRELDLRSAINRSSVVSAIEKQAERSGYWVIQPVGDRRALIPNAEVLQ